MKSKEVSERTKETNKWLKESYGFQVIENLGNGVYRYKTFNDVIVDKELNCIRKTMKGYQEIGQIAINHDEIIMNPNFEFIQNFGYVLWFDVKMRYGVIKRMNTAGYRIRIAAFDRFKQICDENNVQIKSDYISAKDKILLDYHCGHEYRRAVPNSVVNSKGEISGCPICKHKKIVPYINDCYTLRSDLIKYFENPDDAVGIGVYNDKYRQFKCPICGTIKITTLSNISYFGFKCEKCSDGFSYPQKMMSAILDQLNISYMYHWRPSWAHYIYQNKQHTCEYDFYLPDYKIIIQMDGGFHYCSEFDPTLQKTHYVDNQKQILAAQNGMELIRVECNYKSSDNKFEYVKQSIIRTCSDAINIQNVDWGSIHIIKSKIVQVCQLWNEGYHTGEIHEITKINTTSISHYLKYGNEAGLCVYNNEQSSKRKGFKLSSKVYKYVKVINYENGYVVGGFYNINSFINNLVNNGYKKIAKSAIRLVYNNKGRNYVYATSDNSIKLTFKNISKDEYDSLKHLDDENIIINLENENEK